MQHDSRARWPSTRPSRVPPRILYTTATSRTRHGSRTWQTRQSRRVESAKWQAVVCRVLPASARPVVSTFDRALYAHTTYLCSTFDSKVRPVGLVPPSLSPIMIPSPQQTNFSLDLTMLATSATIKTQFARQSSLRSSRTKKTMMVKVRRMARWRREETERHPSHSLVRFALCALLG